MYGFALEGPAHETLLVSLIYLVRNRQFQKVDTIDSKTERIKDSDQGPSRSTSHDQLILKPPFNAGRKALAIIYLDAKKPVP